MFKLSSIQNNIKDLQKISVNKLKDNGVDAELVFGEGMTHVYPIYPWFPSQRKQ